MASIPKSGYGYPNHVARAFLLELENLMGKNGVSAMLNRSGLEPWIAAPPPEDTERGVDFAEFSALLAALDDLYGPRGGRGLARRAGWAVFPQILPHMPALRSVADLPGRALPAPEKLGLALQALAEAFTSASDQQAAVVTESDALIFTVQRCPACWGRKVEDGPACAAIDGLLEECIHWLFGGEPTRIEETECIALGGTSCSFRIPRPAA
ncbi:MAG: 4-vinyl reductase [Chloroflexi bacterium]|nr:4-vinyl reductase [Chloroflexota bacterium]